MRDSRFASLPAPGLTSSASPSSASCGSPKVFRIHRNAAGRSPTTTTTWATLTSAPFRSEAHTRRQARHRRRQAAARSSSVSLAPSRTSVPARRRSCRRSRGARIAGRSRRPTFEGLLEFFDRGRQDGQSFEAGIQLALERVLVDPDFLLRVYRDSVEARTRSIA